ncbi:MAG: RNA methyltransferase [candidate division Zixibacteria bacterium]|nr:RNA methyltransferase [candidate division Zixibacteria bacterium]
MVTTAKIKYLSSLKFKKHRLRESKFLIEGENLLKSAISGKANIEEIYYSEEFPEKRLRQLGISKKIPVFKISSSHMKKVSSLTSPPGIAAIIPCFNYGFSAVGSFRRLLYFDGISDPGNIGTLIRSASAFGFKGIMLSPECCEIYNPKLLRSSAGYIFNQPIYDNILRDNLIELKKTGYKLISADSEAENSINRYKCPRKAILILGNEPHGISGEIGSIVDISLKIPTDSNVDSLNVASAGAIMMFWASGQP